MQTNQSMITYAYHFLSEAIIIFLITIPIFYHKYEFVPYGSYLAVIVVFGFLFLLISNKVKYGWNIVLAPVLFGVFYILDYPIIIAAAFAVLLVWRFINIRKEALIHRENHYIVATLLLTAVVSILVHDSLVMLYPFLQFVILFLGYIFSQVYVVNSNDRKQINYRLPLYFVGLLAVGAGIFFVIFDSVRNTVLSLTQGILNGAGAALRGGSDLLSFFTVKERGWPKQTPEEAKHGDGYWDELQQFNVIEGGSILLIAGVSVILLVALGVIIYSLIKRKKRNSDASVEKSDAVSYGSLMDRNGQGQILKNPFKKYFKKPSHPIRKLVYQFEKKASKSNNGRMASETLEDWIARTRFNLNFDSYQKVRYGLKEVTDEELKELKLQLKEIETKL
ncbi:hypothetical protein [Ornithinibacillus halophilus]|uniref:DUF4129 domain-containing protein n=1 Tax=Ornithinibacillus halophilus TaxID=930117 RepID=A0A1M5F770_9BACI|nr:hypothetical protein [Ornithinibacillus halophilus]SHF87228.1 hypothetical protein SAMN05216225_100778 [Ornithinibacillus halophilus]